MSAGFIDEMLAKVGAPKDFPFSSGVEKIMHIFASANLECINELNERGFGRDGKYKGGCTQLHIIAAHIMPTTVEAIRLVVTKWRASVDAKDDTGCTPLMMAVSSKNLVAIQALIELGADLTLTNVYGNSPLSIAKRNKELLLTNLEAYGDAAGSLFATIGGEIRRCNDIIEYLETKMSSRGTPFAACAGAGGVGVDSCNERA